MLQIPKLLVFGLLVIIGLGACTSAPDNANEKAQSPDLQLEKQEGATPRNVIFILSDDHRYDYMSFMEENPHPWLKTPHLDRLAAEGAHFENAFVTTSLCSPSRASILTGQFSHVHEVVDNHALEPDDLVYFPQYLQQAGYNTSFIGKWHMGYEDASPRKGFDHWVSFKGQGQYYNPTLNVNGETIPTTDSTYMTKELTRYAMKWLDEQKGQEEPFFMYLSHKAVHGMYYPAPEHEGMYIGKPINYPATMNITDPEILNGTQSLSAENKETLGQVNFEGIPQWVIDQRYSWHGVDYAYHRENYMDTVIWTYNEVVHSLDASIGTLLNYLDENNMTKNTVVIYMGDNGFMFGEHGLIDKRQMYEASMRVPLLVRAPGYVDGGTTISAQVQNIDIAPTILDMAGLQPPENMNGKSFNPILKGEDIDWREKIYYEYFWEQQFPQTPTMFGVRTNDYKYIYYYGIWDTNELYNLQQDPHEVNNLIKSPDHQEIAREMKQDVYNWLQKTGGMQIPLKEPPMQRFDYKNQGYY